MHGQSGVYGTLGTPAAGNIPGGRAGAVSLDRQQRQFLALWGLWLRCRRTCKTGSTTFGSSILPQTNGHGWAEAARSSAMVASPECTARWVFLPQETSPQAASGLRVGPTGVAISGSLGGRPERPVGVSAARNPNGDGDTLEIKHNRRPAIDGDRCRQRHADADRFGDADQRQLHIGGHDIERRERNDQYSGRIASHRQRHVDSQLYARLQ